MTDWIWIDALGIHQDDQDEKNSHIGRMKDIYHEANLVVVWLGCGSRRIFNAMKVIQRLVSDKWRRSNPSYIDHARSCIAELLCNNYWSRVWIIQEIALGPEILICYDSLEISWKDLQLGLGLAYGEDSFATQVTDQLSKIRIDRLESKPVGLLQALFKSQKSQASHRFDRVYALLGLAFDSHKFVTKSNYELTDHRFCLTLTENFIRDSRSLDIILAGKKINPDSDLPTWCPDYLQFGGNHATEHLARYISGHSTRYRLGRGHHRWNTTGTSIATKQNVLFCANGLLRVRGMKVCDISGRGALLTESESSIQSDNLGSKEKFTDTSVFDALDRTLTMYDRGFVAKGSGSRHKVRIYHRLFDFMGSIQGLDSELNRFHAKHRDVIRWSNLNRFFRVQGNSLRTRSNGFKSWALYGGINATVDVLENGTVTWDSKALRTKTEWAENWVTNRIADYEQSKHRAVPELDSILTSLGDLVREELRLMTTYQRDIGWAHSDAKVGDKIFLLAGCSMPVILRDTDRTGVYQVVGYAYVDGMMDNEMWSVYEELRAKDVWLC